MNWKPVRALGKLSNCVAYPTLWKRRWGSEGGMPRTRISPRVGRISPVIRFISVVLPEPLGPTRLVMPGGMERVTRLTPRTSP